MSMLSLSRAFAAVVFLAVSTLAAQAFTIQEVESPGGIKAWLVHEKAVPLIAMDFSFKGGSARDPADKLGVSEFLTGMMDEGAGEMLSAEFQQKRDALAFQMSFESGRDYFGGSFQTLSRNRAESFELLRLAISSPRFDAEPLERVRQQFILGVKNDAQDPQTIAFKNWMNAVLPGDPYARENTGTEASMSTISADDLRAAHKRIFTRNTLQVAVVGDIEATELGPLLDKLFGSLPEGAAAAELPLAKPAQLPNKVTQAQDIPQSVIIFGHEGIKRDDPDFMPAYVMSEILGGGGFSSRLTAEIREKRGLTYGVDFSMSPMQRLGLYVGSLQTANEKAGEALGLVRDVLARMAADGPNQAELDEAKTYLTGSYALRFSSNNAIANQLLALQQQGLGKGYIERRNSLIEAVTLDQVKAQAKRLLHPDRLIVSIVGKPEGTN